MSVYMGYLASYFRRSAGVPGRLKDFSMPLFMQKPTGLALFGPVVLGINGFTVVYLVPMTWRQWTYAPEGTKPPVLRPWHHRASACALQLVVSACAAFTVLIYRGRMVTFLSLLPPKNPNVAPTPLNRRIFLQSSGNWARNGTIFPLSACTLTRVEKDVMFLQVKGEYSGWQLNLDRSVVDGKPVTSIEDACKVLAARWQGAGGKATIITA